MNVYMHLFTLNVGFAERQANWNWKNVRSPFARLYYVTEGEAQVELAGHVQPLKKGYMYYIPAYVKHNCVCNSSFSHYYLHVYEDPQLGDCLLDKLLLPTEVKGTEIDLALFQRLCRLNPTMALSNFNPQIYDNQADLAEKLEKNRKRDLTNKVESRGILYILISRFLENAKQRIEFNNRHINNSLLYIQQHLGEKITEETLATIACMSRDHYIRVFKQVMGMTPVTYINSKRIERAELELLATNKSIKEISDSLSFGDSSYFINLFKRLLGVTPLQYRKEKQYL